VEVDRRRQARSRASAARRAATTTTASGSTRTIPTSCCSRPIRARSSPSTAARRGAPGTTSRPRSSITSAPTTRSRIASAAASRRAARRASEPRRRRADHVSRLAPGRRRGVRLRRARSARSRHRLRRQGHRATTAARAGRSHPSVRGGRARDYRVVRTQPVVFSPVDPRTLYFASKRLWKTTNGGAAGQISPDLTRKTWDVPANVGKYASLPAAQPTQRGVIYTIAPSPLDVNRSGPAPTTADSRRRADGGKTWTTSRRRARAVGEGLDHGGVAFRSANTAYAAINTFRLDDLRPHIYRTRDGGKTWTHITNGIPDGAIVNVVREDPKAKGCCSPAPRRRSTSRSTTAITGSRCASTCRRRRSAIS
jgi:hypothetical protein